MVGTICKTQRKGRNRVAWMFSFAGTGLSEAGTRASRHVRRLVLPADRQARSAGRSQLRDRPQENEEVAGLYRRGCSGNPTASENQGHWTTGSTLPELSDGRCRTEFKRQTRYASQWVAMQSIGHSPQPEFGQLYDRRPQPGSGEVRGAVCQRAVRSGRSLR